MIIGVAVVIGSFVYAITRLRPLEIQISERQGQLKIAEEQLSATREKLNDADEQLNLVGRETAQLGDKSRKLKDEIETAQEQLSKIGAKTNDASAELKKIANGPLPGNARPMIETAISNIDEIVKHIKGIEGELGNSKEGPPSKSNGDRSSAIADLFSDQASMRIKAYSVLMDNYSTDPNLIPELLLFARKHLDNENGIYNTLVVLSHLDKKQTKPQVNEIKALAQQVEGKGPKIKERVDKLLNRLPG
jgi:DNA repair exonuclease SbcCD ATPase subunit